MVKTLSAGLLAVLALAGTAIAQETRSPRVAVVELDRVYAESQLGKGYAAQIDALRKDLQATAAKKQADFGKLQNELKALQDEVEKQRAVLSAEAREKKQAEITRKGREVQAFAEDAQQEMDRLQQKLQQQGASLQDEFQLKVHPLIEQVAKAKSVDVVMDLQAAQYVNREFDLTPQVIEAADKLAPVPARAAGPAAPKPTGPAAPQPKP